MRRRNASFQNYARLRCRVRRSVQPEDNDVKKLVSSDTDRDPGFPENGLSDNNPRLVDRRVSKNSNKARVLE